MFDITKQSVSSDSIPRWDILANEAESQGGDSHPKCGCKEFCPFGQEVCGDCEEAGKVYCCDPCCFLPCEDQCYPKATQTYSALPVPSGDVFVIYASDSCGLMNDVPNQGHVKLGVNLDFLFDLTGEYSVKTSSGIVRGPLEDLS